MTNGGTRHDRQVVTMDQRQAVRAQDRDTPAPARAVLTVGEAAAVLGISRGLAYELARSGELPVIRLGRRLVVPRAALEDRLRRPGARVDDVQRTGFV